MSIDARAAEAAVEDDDLAIAVGLVAMGDADHLEAADSAGVSRWQLVEKLREVGVRERTNAAEL